MLRPGLLAGASMLVVAASAHAEDGHAGETDGAAVMRTCGELGADARMRWLSDGDAAARDAAAADDTGLDVLVVDGHSIFMACGLDGCLARAWQATQTVVNRAFLERIGDGPRGGRIVYLAPRPGAGAEADAARAGLENLARTLSVEWARHGITTVAVALGDATTPGEAATLATYLASPAGAYFSGCQMDLRGS